RKLAWPGKLEGKRARIFAGCKLWLVPFGDRERERVQIARTTVPLGVADEHFRGEVPRSAALRNAAFDESSQTQVDQARFVAAALLAHQDVGRLHVAMCDSGRVQIH